MHVNNQGFTLIELMIVVAIIAIVAVVAVPNLLSAKVAANESDTISALRNLATSQAQFQALVAIDNDLDGTGEFGCFGELSGTSMLNNRGNGPARVLNPAILATIFRSPDAGGIVTKSGYNFIIYLPGAVGAGVVADTGGPALPVASALVDDDNCEVFWSAYAWPVAAGTSGSRAFFVNHRGDITQTRMDAAVHTGAVAPLWNAAHSSVPAPIDMSDNIATGAGGVGVGADGNRWVPVQ